MNVFYIIGYLAILIIYWVISGGAALGEEELFMHTWMIWVTVVPALGFTAVSLPKDLFAEAKKKYGNDENFIGQVIWLFCSIIFFAIPCYIVLAYIPYRTWALMVNTKEFITGMF